MRVSIICRIKEDLNLQGRKGGMHKLLFFRMSLRQLNVSAVGNAAPKPMLFYTG